MTFVVIVAAVEEADDARSEESRSNPLTSVATSVLVSVLEIWSSLGASEVLSKQRAGLGSRIGFFYQ